MVYRYKPNELFGYCIRAKQTAIDSQERQLYALDVSFDEGGIQALLPCFEGQIRETETNWIRVTGTACPQKRLDLNGAIRAMRGEFDVSIPTAQTVLFSDKAYPIDYFSIIEWYDWR